MTIKDSTKTITSSAKSFFSGTAISRSFGLIREVLMAAAFGTSPQVAAFWMAYRFSHLLRRLFGEGALNAAFVPHFEHLRKEDAQKGARFFYDLSMGITLLLLGVALGLEAILGCFLFFGHLEETALQVVRLTMLMLPALVFISLYALNTSLLNCERRFFLPSVAPAFLNFVWITAVFFLWKAPAEQAMERLAMIMVLAFGVQWFVTVPDVYLYLKKDLGQAFWQQKRVSFREIGGILRPFLLALLGVAATQINSALDAIFARIAHPEGPAYLWYAIRIQQLPLALFGVGLTGALLPPIARAFRNQDIEQYKKFVYFAFKQSILFMIPMTFGIFALGFSGINLVYGHGEFSGSSVLKTTICLWGYGLGLLPMTAVLILASAFYAKKNYRVPTYLAIGSVGFNIILNASFVFLFRLDALSIALSTTITAFLNSLFLAFFLKKESGQFLKGIFVFFAKIFTASFAAAAASLLLGHLFYGDQTLIWLLGEKSPIFSPIFKEQFLAFTLMAATFVFTFAVFSIFLKIREIFDLLPARLLKISKVRL